MNAWYYEPGTRVAIIHILDQHEQDFIPFGKNIILNTRDGQLTITPGDYLIQGSQGNFYNCKEDVFNATYEIVTENL